MKPPFKKFFLTDEFRISNPLNVIRSLPQEVGVIFRHYDENRRKKLAREISKLCKVQKRALLISRDISLAKELGAGLHIPEYMVKKTTKIQLANFPLVTASAHSLKAIRQANALGVDALFLSPIFKTESHKDIPPLGSYKFSSLAQLSKCPVFALGGITQKNIALIPKTNVFGFGAIGMFLNKTRS